VPVRGYFVMREQRLPSALFADSILSPLLLPEC
jgi:hypothetical protein